VKTRDFVVLCVRCAYVGFKNEIFCTVFCVCCGVFNPVSEMHKLRCVIGDLQDKLSALKEANNNNVKEKIDAQNCAEELRKHLEESTM
jgi:hypothetical protein